MKFNIFKNKFDAFIHPEVVIDITFEEFATIMVDSCREVVAKEDQEMFNLCAWREDFVSPNDKEGYIRRCKENVTEVYALLLDVDGNRTLANIIAEYAEYEFLVYSTFGNSAEKEKFRLILPLVEPLTAFDFELRKESIKTHFGVDDASFAVSQAFYFPCYTAENKDIHFVYWNEKPARYDVMPLEIQFVSTNIVNGPIDGEVDPLAPSIYKTLLTGSNLRYADALPLAVLCKSKGLGEADFRDIINTVAGHDSSLRTGLANLDTIWREAYSTHIRNETMLNLMRRLNCDTWRFGDGK